jgi:hypothetical protein
LSSLRALCVHEVWKPEYLDSDADTGRLRDDASIEDRAIGTRSVRNDILGRWRVVRLCRALEIQVER